jgi:hypothetical protein
MCRSSWELDVYVRHHIAQLADECRAYTAIDQKGEGPARLLTEFRHRLGIGLIQIGQALAGYEAVRSLSTPPSRPAQWGTPGS